jgi:type II secretory pathway pseudopilin PulG
MKLAVKATVFIIGIIMMLLIIMAITSNSARGNEQEQALAAAVEQSLKQLKLEQNRIEDYQELISDFSQSLLLQVSSDSDVTVKVLAADMKRGLLDIEIAETYRSIRGNKKEVICRKTVLFEEHDDTYLKKYRTIRFYVAESVFANYTAYDGSMVVDPGDPKLAGKQFKYWKPEPGKAVSDLSQVKVAGDMKFVAVFE